MVISIWIVRFNSLVSLQISNTFNFSLYLVFGIRAQGHGTLEANQYALYFSYVKIPQKSSWIHF